MSAMISQTLQGAVLSATSNIIAQAIAAYKDDTTFSLDFAPVLKFAIFSIISNPPNIIWQTFLEDLFPNNVPATPTPSEKSSKKVATTTQRSTRNILIKFLLDQTVGALVNNLMFLAFIAYTGPSNTPDVSAWTAVSTTVRENLVPMAIDGYKFWPAVSLISFLWIPVQQRVVFGCAAGMLWGIYLSLMVKA